MEIPKFFDIPAAWHGVNLASKPETWTYVFNNQEIRELEHAAASFRESNTPLGLISKKTFPLPNLGVVLMKMQDELRNGLGFKLLRGLPTDNYDPAINSAIFCGIGSHLGSARSQNAAGHLLGHVRDIGADINDPNSRIYQTKARQHFHTDSCDVVGLLCLKKAKSGGKSLLASSVTVYNEIAQRRPDLLEYLFQPIARDRRGEIPDGKKPFYSVPVYNWFKGFLTCFYHREYIDSAQRYEAAPKMSEKQKAAIDFFDQIANEPSINLGMDFEPGDIQFVYNHHLLHDRTEYQDWPEKTERRHLLRLWLALPKDRPLPRSFAERYGKIKIGDRGGVVTNKTILHAPFDA